MVVFCTDLNHQISPTPEKDGALNHHARYEARDSCAGLRKSFSNNGELRSEFGDSSSDSPISNRTCTRRQSRGVNIVGIYGTATPDGTRQSLDRLNAND